MIAGLHDGLLSRVRPVRRDGDDSRRPRRSHRGPRHAPPVSQPLAGAGQNAGGAARLIFVAGPRDHGGGLAAHAYDRDLISLKGCLESSNVAPLKVEYYERPGDGRGFVMTGVHSHKLLEMTPYRREVLNGIVWAAGLEVPAGGVVCTLPDETPAPAPAAP